MRVRSNSPVLYRMCCPRTTRTSSASLPVRRRAKKSHFPRSPRRLPGVRARVSESTSVGGRRNFRLARIVALTYLSLRLGKLDLFATPGYTIYAIFDDITGLKSHDRVEIAAVKVGQVA